MTSKAVRYNYGGFIHLSIPFINLQLPFASSPFSPPLLAEKPHLFCLFSISHLCCISQKQFQFCHLPSRMTKTTHKVQDMATETVHEFTLFSIPLLRSFNTVCLFDQLQDDIFRELQQQLNALSQVAIIYLKSFILYMFLSLGSSL